MSDMLNVPSPDVLMNRGIGTLVNVVKKNENGEWQRAIDGEGNLITEPYWVRMTNWGIALIESPAPLGFGSTDNWQKAFEVTPLRSMAQTMALLDNKMVIVDGVEMPDIRYGAERLRDGFIAQYAVAFVNSFMLAQGVPPEKIALSVEKSRAKFEKNLEESLRELDEQQNDDAADSDTQTNPSDSPS